MNRDSKLDGQCCCTLALIDCSRLRPHEETEKSRIEELVSEISCEGVLKYPVIVDKASMVILDGHHRVSVLAKLGCIFVPAYLVNYYDENIQVSDWGNASRSVACMSKVTKESVVSAALTGHLFPPKTSRHIWPWHRQAHPMPVRVLQELASCTKSWR